MMATQDSSPTTPSVDGHIADRPYATPEELMYGPAFLLRELKAPPIGDELRGEALSTSAEGVDDGSQPGAAWKS